jgi:hypothetical protein
MGSSRLLSGSSATPAATGVAEGVAVPEVELRRGGKFQGGVQCKQSAGRQADCAHAPHVNQGHVEHAAHQFHGAR